MARNMAEEILRSEKQGEIIISTAERKAREIVERAGFSASEDAERIKAEAYKKAEQISADAILFCDSERRAAEAAAADRCRELEQAFNKNSEAAIEAAIGLLFS